MQTYGIRDSRPVLSQLALTQCPPSTTRYAIRTENGFLAACTGIGGVPVQEVSDPFAAVRFADIDAAAHRARLLIQLGWHNLRIVALRVPLA
jgi:hypothetical protein